MTAVARHVVNNFRRQLFHQFMRLPASYYDHNSSGKLLSKMIYDAELISHASADAIATLVQSTCLIIGLLFVMFYNSWQLSLFFIVSIPVVGLLINYTNKRTRRVSMAAQKTKTIASYYKT